MVTAPNDDWTEDLCIRLIHEYRKRPILWDPKDPFFFKKAMKPEAWEGIAEAINMPADLCKHKMVILQSSFRREKSKIMQSIRDSPGKVSCYMLKIFFFGLTIIVHVLTFTWLSFQRTPSIQVRGLPSKKWHF